GAPVVLDVRTDNGPAVGLYTAHGFEVVGLRPRYYRPSMADAHLMVRPARDASRPGAGDRRAAREDRDGDREFLRRDGGRRGPCRRRRARRTPLRRGGLVDVRARTLRRGGPG